MLLNLLATLIISLLILCYLIAKLTCARAKTSVCLLNKTVLLTGADSGIGFEIAKDLLKRGCQLVIAVQKNGERTKQKLFELTHNPKIIAKELELSSFEKIRKFAADVNSDKSIEKIDVLINNAGIGYNRFKFTEDNLHETMQVNYFGPFLLTHLLMDKVKKSDAGRIIFTSSLMAFYSHLTIDNLLITTENLQTVNHTEYGNSKLCNIIAAKIFAERLRKYRITCNAIHPGFVNTPIFMKSFEKDRYYSQLLGSYISKIFGKSAEEGAQTTIHVAVSQEVQNVSGKLFSDCRPFFMHPKAKDKKFSQEIWEASEKIVKLKPDEKLYNFDNKI